MIGESSTNYLGLTTKQCYSASKSKLYGSPQSWRSQHMFECKSRDENHYWLTQPPLYQVQVRLRQGKIQVRTETHSTMEVNSRRASNLRSNQSAPTQSSCGLRSRNLSIRGCLHLQLPPPISPLDRSTEPGAATRDRQMSQTRSRGPALAASNRIPDSSVPGE